MAPAANISCSTSTSVVILGHEPAHGVAIEIAHGQSLHVGEQLDTEIGQAALSHQYGQVVLEEKRRALRQQGGEEENSRGDQGEAVAGADGIDAGLEEQRLGQVETLVHRQQQHRQEEDLPVRPDEPPEAPGQLYVVGLAGNLLVFSCIHRNKIPNFSNALPSSELVELVRHLLPAIHPRVHPVGTEQRLVVPALDDAAFPPTRGSRRLP